MPELDSPELSVVIVTPDRYDTIRNTIRCLCAQTARDRLEVVIVAPSAEALQLDASELKGLHGFRVVAVDEVRSVASANAAGIRQARAPVVALAEDHSFPDPGWAEALIRAHREPWAAVGPVVRNANPGSLVSWADFLIGYGPWLEHAQAGEVDHLPGHNSSYKRDVLLAYGPQLADLLEAESVLHGDLRAKGYRLYLEPAAKTSHMNFGILSSWLPVQFHCGRVFAAVRARGWSKLRRLLYAAGAPLIPLVRLRRILRHTRRPGGYHDLFPRVLPVLFVGLALDAAGQMLGYAFGPGKAVRKLARSEFHRHRHVRDRVPQVVIPR